VAGVVVDTVTDAIAAGVTIDIDPVVVMARLEALAILEAVLGRTARRSHLPIGTAKLIGKLGGLINPGLGHLMETMASEGAARDSTAPPDRHVTPSTIFDHVARAWANDLAAT
jgi:hypothetical protein